MNFARQVKNGVMHAEGVSDSNRPVCCILAGGRSQRMAGRNKALVELAGRPMLGHVIARLERQVKSMAINANRETDRIAAFGLPVIADRIEGHAGPLAGLLAGLEWAEAGGARALISVPVDTPFLPRDLVTRLRTACRGNDIACAASGGRIHPVIGLWPVGIRDQLRHALTVEEVRKVDAWTARFRLGIAEWPALPYDPFFNINRPDDLVEAERIASKIHP